MPGHPPWRTVIEPLPRESVRYLSDFDCPSYDQDVQAADGFPSWADEFRQRLGANDTFAFVSPEYNASFRGALRT